ncbi:MAG: PAS domain-containing sensor histidine kinase [Desulfobacteraceae bacterium]|nr:MAG: PAS domain-containing sensor histidine kinase [Desulfobacteraceae bacterium]
MTAEKTNQNYPSDTSNISEKSLCRQTEEALRESEARYRDLVENATDLICTHDLKGTLLSVNSAAAKAGGLRVEDVAGLRLQDLLPEDRRHEFYDYIETIRRDGKAKGIMKVMTPDGVRYWEYRNTLRTEGVPEPIVRGMARDVTGEVLARKALKKSEEKYRLLFERNLAGVYRTTIDGKFLDCNDAYARIYGYQSREEIMKVPVVEFYPSPKSREEFIAALQSNGTRQNLENRRLRKDGSTIWLLENASLVPDKDGNLTEIEGTLIDITERKKMEEELLKADKLESVGILAGGIAHDFNNILTSIIGNISLAGTYVNPGSKAFDLLNAAETAAIKASGLSSRLLTFARGGLPAKETTSISDLIKESSLDMLKGSKSKCELIIEEDLWPVEADPRQISQVISNIVINADQAMPDGGIVKVKADNLVLDEKNEMRLKPGRYIRISVKDQGVGIAEKHLSKIFDPYFTTKSAGSGLGLATAYSIIKKHNGHISIDSRPGAGTEFHIHLPASDKTVSIIEETGQIKGRWKILWMDDDGMLREMAEAMLEILGYEAEFATEGAEAVEMYKKAMESEKPYDAVFLDLTIPGGMGGKEAIKKLMELDPQIKAVVSSGYSEDPVMSNYRGYGFKGMMPKPFDLNSLGRVLNDVLKNQESGVGSHGSGKA